MSSTCEKMEAKVELKNVDDSSDNMDAKSNVRTKTQIDMGENEGSFAGAFDSVRTDKVDVSVEKQTTLEPGTEISHKPIDSEAIGNQTESDMGHTVTESIELEIIDKMPEKQTFVNTERDTCNVKTDMAVRVIKKEAIGTEVDGNVPEILKTLSTGTNDITVQNEVINDIEIKVEPIDSDDQPIISRDGVEILKTENLMSYRQIKTEKDGHDSGTENDSGDDSSVVFSDAPIVASDEESESKAFIPKEVPRTRGELLPEDLPPLEELKINITKDEKLLLIGQVSGIVNTLAVIQSLPDTPALNEDSVFFNEDRKVFGKVFEIFGPVAKPFYSIRFNSLEEINNKKINIGDKVYCAPNLEEITQYIFLDQLKQLKGSDASWKDNNEPPERCIDYSDDESERKSKAKRKVDKEIKEEDEESYLNALPGAMGQRSSKPQRRRKQKKHQNDRDRPVSDSFPPNTNNQNMWNCWPPKGPAPRFAPPSNQSHYNDNFRQPPPSAPWHQHQQGQNVHPWQQPSMNQRNFNPQHNFHYQNLPHMNQMPFGNGNPPNQGNPNLFMNNVPNGGQNNTFSYSQNQNSFCSGLNQNNSFQHASVVPNSRFLNPLNSGYSQNTPQIVDSRFIQSNQSEDTPIHNPYHAGIPK